MQARLFAKIKKGVYSFHDEYWLDISAEAKDLIAKMLTVDPDQRITAAEALEHPYLKVCYHAVRDIAIPDVALVRYFRADTSLIYLIYLMYDVVLPLSTLCNTLYLEVSYRTVRNIAIPDIARIDQLKTDRISGSRSRYFRADRSVMSVIWQHRRRFITTPLPEGMARYGIATPSFARIGQLKSLLRYLDLSRKIDP